MKKVLEPLLVFLIICSVIELLTTIFSALLYSYFGYTNSEAMLNSRIIVIELFVAGLAAFVYNKRFKK